MLMMLIIYILPVLSTPYRLEANLVKIKKIFKINNCINNLFEGKNIFFCILAEQPKRECFQYLLKFLF